MFLVGHGYAPVVTVKDGDGNVAFSGPVIFLPQDSSFVSYGVIKAPDASPAAVRLRGLLLPDRVACAADRRARCSPTLTTRRCRCSPTPVTSASTTGSRESVYVLDKDDLEQVKTPGGNPQALLLTEGKTVDLGEGRGSITFEGYQRWVRLQISNQPVKVVPLGRRTGGDRRFAGIVVHPPASYLGARPGGRRAYGGRDRGARPGLGR